jgi:hypothetical protein
VKLTAVQKNDIVKRVRACRYKTQAEALHAAVQLAEDAMVAMRPAPLTVAQMVDVVEPLCADREVAEALVQTSMDEYRAIETAHGITGGAA